MINIVHALFRPGGQPCNTATVPGPPAFRLRIARAVVLAGLAGAPLPAGIAPAAAGGLSACGPDGLRCPGRRPPGPPDRDVRPFDGTLGRPCAYRWRFTPSGTRRVRVCF